MLYSERDLQMSNFNEISRLLSNATYLTEQECMYYPEMVPIRENLRLQRDIIRLEDFVDYSLANGITEAGYSLAQICEANGISQNNIAFSVDEVSILEDPEMEDTVRCMLETGQEVYATPINSNDIAYILGEAVVSAANICLAQDNEEYCDALIESYIVDNFDILLNEEYIINYIVDRSMKTRGTWLNESMDVDDVRNKVVDSAKNASNWTAKKISSLKSIAREKLNDTNNFAGNTTNRLKSSLNKSKGFFSEKYNAIKNKINSGIDYLSDKLRKKKKSLIGESSSAVNSLMGNSGNSSSSSGSAGKGDWLSNNKRARDFSAAFRSGGLGKGNSSVTSNSPGSSSSAFTANTSSGKCNTF